MLSKRTKIKKQVVSEIIEELGLIADCGVQGDIRDVANYLRLRYQVPVISRKIPGKFSSPR